MQSLRNNEESRNLTDVFNAARSWEVFRFVLLLFDLPLSQTIAINLRTRPRAAVRCSRNDRGRFASN